MVETIFAKWMLKEEIVEIGKFKKGKDVRKHLSKVEKKIDTLKVKQEDRFDFLAKTLDEDILLELEAHVDFEEDFDWAKKILLKIYGEHYSEIKSRCELLKIQQVQLSLKDYLSEIRISGVKYLGRGMDSAERERILVMAFIEGLRNANHKKILRQINPPTMDEAFELLKNEGADQVDDCIYKIETHNDITFLKEQLEIAMKKIQSLENEIEKMKRRSNVPAKEKIKCHYCFEEGHIKKNCKKLNANLNRCDICKKNNHKTENCFYKHNKIRNVDIESVESTDTDDILNSPTDQIDDAHEHGINDAYAVSKPSKFSKDLQCPKKILIWENFVKGQGAKPRKPILKLNTYASTVISKSNPEKAANKPIVSALVENEIEKNILFDTGCECNIVDQKFLRELTKVNPKIKYVKSNGYLSCANGSPLKVIGHTVLNVQVGSRRMLIKFVVVSSIFPKMLIGLRTMKREFISIFPENDCLKVNGCFVPFVSKTKVTNLN